MASREELSLSLVIRANAMQFIEGMRNATSAITNLNAHADALKKTFGRVAEGMAALGAGAAVADFVKDSAAEAIKSQAESARTAGVLINDGAKATQHLAEVQKFAIDTSSKLAITEDVLKESYDQARFSGLTHAQAIVAAAAGAKLAIGTTQSVAAANAQAADSTRMLATSYRVFGGSINAIADSYARLQMNANFRDQSELNAALQEAVGTSQAYNVTLAQQNAILAQLTGHGKFASEAGTSYVELISKLGASNKKMYAFAAAANGDLIKEIGLVAQATAGMSDIQKQAWLQAHGFEMRSVQGIVAVLDGYKDMTAQLSQYGDAAKGANDALFAKRAGALDEQLAVAANNYQNFKEALGTTLIPLLTSATMKAAALFRTLRQFAEAHRTVAKLAIGFLGISAAISGISGVLSILGVARTATLAWTAAQWLLNAALDANPIGLAILAAAALAATAYEVYEHWAAVKAFFISLGGFFKSLGVEIYHALLWPFVALPNAIRAEVAKIKEAAASVAGGIGRFFVGHSPIPEGPLHNLNVGHQIAQSMKPAQVFSAAQKVAAAVALSMPLAIASPAAAMMMPPMVHAMRGGANVTIAPHIEIHTATGNANEIGEAVLDAMRKYGRELTEVVDEEHRHHNQRLY
jgi:TP901 family phage tail tape measure protein